MSAKRSSAKSAGQDGLRTWVEIDRRAIKENYDGFRALIGPKVKLWSVVKSNAYGHGLYAFTKVVEKLGVDGFCVDSLVEGLALRKNGIKKPILVLGPTLPSLLKEAAAKKIAITISNFGALQELAHAKTVPEFQLKIDTGMHRQGFYVEDVLRAAQYINSKKNIKNKLTGVYTHFASAKGINYSAYTEEQLKKFEAAVQTLEAKGFKKLMKHVSATGGALLDAKYHKDVVRVGIGLHGIWPSKELEEQVGHKIKLHPTLHWRAVVSEVKKLKKGDYVGYDLTERIPEDMMMAVIPIGYWHGFPRALSGVGEVIIRGRRQRVLGRVSMDLLAVTAAIGVAAGDIVTLIGSDGREVITAESAAEKAGTSAYELLTRLNPLMERIVV